MSLKDKLQKIGKIPHDKKIDTRDIAFMDSLNAAVIQRSPVNMAVMLYIIGALMLLFIIWASFAEVDELTRGVGRVIPSSQIQIVQNLEGGIVDKILVKEGDQVTKGQVLVQIDDTGFGSSFQESNARLNEMRARAVRLRAEAGTYRFAPSAEEKAQFESLLDAEKKLYEINMRRRDSERDVLSQQLQQRKIELADAEGKIRNLEKSKTLIRREVELTEPLYKKGLVSEVEFLQLKRKAVENNSELETVAKSIESIRSKIIEFEQRVIELKAKHEAEAQQELSKVLAEIERIGTTQVALQDRVNRTLVRSPVDGTVKQLLVNTVGGVVRPGMDIVEIVPHDDTLLVEAKVKPSDIAFIYPGQKAILKFSAYDFAIYGGLEGTVVHISADTITDERQESYYLVRVKADQTYLGTEDNKKTILVGMTVQTDIVTGKKTVMQYLFKPILRAKYNALRER